MIDVFLMGTVGESIWREPFKAAYSKAGISFFDPRVEVWTEEAGRQEAQALRDARIVVMAITNETAGIGALAESGWAALSAVKRKQAFGLYIDPAVVDLDEPGIVALGGRTLVPQPNDNLEEVSRRARKLVLLHATELARQFADLNIYIAGTLAALQTWSLEVAKKRRPKR